MKHLSEGESISVQGSGKNPYIVKNSGGVISCSCPAWRNQSLAIDMRTCKHIKANVSNGAAASVQSGSVVNGTAKAPNPTKAAVIAPPCLLAHTWDGEQDLTGWWVSPKLDGVRAWWDGTKFISRLGNEYHAPQWFLDAMPKGVTLDGELFAGNGKFQETVSTVRKMNAVDVEWTNIRFMVFDMPLHGGTYEKRLEMLSKLISPGSAYCNLVNTMPLQAGKLEEELITAENRGYEGIMLREPKSLYVDGRSHTLLKVKSFKDCEATVIDYEKGKGKHKGRMGALVVRLLSGVEFSVGSGFTDKERETPPKLGSTITVKYQELTKDGVPRFPTYISERDYE